MAGSSSYANPVYPENFPDPGVLRVAGTYYAYGTQGPLGNIQLLASTDLVRWSPHGDALPTLGAWATAGNTWAPEVLAVGSRYEMYYVARATREGVQCVGRAEATNPLGPFRDGSAGPLVCQRDLGGSIDPDPFRDADGQLYLYWKNDGNCCGKPVHLWVSRLSADGTRLAGPARPILTNTKRWQGNLVEAPEMFRRGGRYYLFYSANAFDTDRYAIGYATCRSALGPCTDQSDQPLVASDAVAAGPGHNFVVPTPDGRTWLLYHAWPPGAIGSTSPGRQLWLSPLTWAGDRPLPIRPQRTGPRPAA